MESALGESSNGRKMVSSKKKNAGRRILRRQYKHSYKTGESKLEKKAREGGYDAERTLLTRTKRMIEENKLKIMNGELHRSNTVKAVMNRMLNNFKSKLQALPLKAAPKVLGETNLLAIQDALLDEVNECLTELSEYDPNMFHDESDDIIVDEDEAGENDWNTRATYLKG